jgi:hypothetical protein
MVDGHLAPCTGLRPPRCISVASSKAQSPGCDGGKFCGHSQSPADSVSFERSSWQATRLPNQSNLRQNRAGRPVVRRARERAEVALSRCLTSRPCGRGIQASISATGDSGSRTVIVFVGVMHYTPVESAIESVQRTLMASFGNAPSRFDRCLIRMFPHHPFCQTSCLAASEGPRSPPLRRGGELSTCRIMMVHPREAWADSRNGAEIGTAVASAASSRHLRHST